MLITSTIPNLINGISQQPPTLRLASQANEQVNFLSSVADGLVDRPATETLAQLTTDTWSDAFIHTINRDTSERYIIAIRDGVLKIFEAETGVERTVTTPDGVGYLTSTGTDKTVFRAVSVADHTFILNREVSMELETTLSPLRPNLALVSVRAGNYGHKYSIHLDGVEVALYETPDGSVAAHSPSVDTSWIATQLYDALLVSAPTGFTFERFGNNITISRVDTTEFGLRVEDGYGGVNLKGYYKTVQRFSDLPPEAPNGFSIEVTGDAISGFDNYHVTFATDNDATRGLGVWKESMKGGEQYKMDASTMAHILVREANGTFTFKEATWGEREVGDLDKVPAPSFIGSTVSDIFFFRNRLGLTADEGVALARDGDPFNFWQATATALLDTDPIDVGAATEQVSIINYAVPFNRTLLLFSDQAQFIMEGGDIFSPNSVSIAQATSFESSKGVRPVGVGSYVYFPTPRGGYSGIREYFVQEGNAQNDARDVTSHAPRYIPKNLFKMAASSSEDTLLLLSEDALNSIWVYRYFITDEGKLQSAWSEWRLAAGDEILNVSFIESNIYLIVARSGGTYLETISLESGAVSTGSNVRFHLDQSVYSYNISKVYDAGTNVTTYTLPYTVPQDDLLVTILGDDAVYPEGTLLPHTLATANTVSLAGDTTARRLLIGRKYNRKFEFSTFYIRSAEAGGGVSADASGRLQLRYLSVDFTRSAYFKLTTAPLGRNPTEKMYSGRVLGVSAGSSGVYTLSTGRFRVPVMAKNTDVTITLESDSHLPCGFTAAEWEATFTTRAKKV